MSFSTESVEALPTGMTHFFKKEVWDDAPQGGSYGAVCMSRFWPSPLLHTADPRRFWRHHQSDLQTFLLEEESRHHVRGPEHQVRPAADWQTGVSPKHVGGVQANAAGAFTDLPHPRYFVCVFVAPLDRQSWHEEVSLRSAFRWSRPRAPHRFVYLLTKHVNI